MSNTVGKAMKSANDLICIAASNTIIEAAILKVKRRSSAKGGRGTSIIAKMAMTTDGATTFEEKPGISNDLRESFILPRIMRDKVADLKRWR